jgi:hypothetical protein
MVIVRQPAGAVGEAGIIDMAIRKWTDTEDEILRTHYADTGIDELLRLLPGRTVPGIYQRAFS